VKIDSPQKNMVANYLGQFWAILMGIVFIPYYVEILGIEAYGLIAFFVLLQSMLNLLDLGITPALGREMARFTGGSHTTKSIGLLLRSIEYVVFILAALMIMTGNFLSDLIFEKWLNIESLQQEDVVYALKIMSVVVALRFIEGVYRGSLLGLQRQVIFNIANASLSTLRWFGAICALLWYKPTIEVYFIWHALVSILAVIVFRSITYSSIQIRNNSVYFSFESLRNIYIFASGVFFVAIISALLSQVDKLVVSKLLPLSVFADYALASVISGGVLMLISPVTRSIYPRLCQLHANNDYDKFVKVFHNGAQLISAITGSAGLVIAVNSDIVLYIWTNNIELSNRVYPVMTVLVLASIVNSLIHMPYRAQLAHGITKLAVSINLVSVLIVVPLMFIVVPKYSVIGAALVWFLINLLYLLIGAQLMFRRVLDDEKTKWYINDILLPLLTIATVVLVYRYLFIDADNPHRMFDLIHIFISFSLSWLALIFVSPFLRGKIVKIICRFSRKCIYKVRYK
jgi:O-antigen/teichoic acid export membrane protein